LSRDQREIEAKRQKTITGVQEIRRELAVRRPVGPPLDA
jgi:hypothetical protein